MNHCPKCGPKPDFPNETQWYTPAVSSFFFVHEYGSYTEYHCNYCKDVWVEPGSCKFSDLMPPWILKAMENKE